MKVHDSQKSLQKAKALLKQIDTEAMNQTYNFIISKVQEKSNADMSNKSIVAEIHKKVNNHISDENVPEATNDNDIGVKYIVDYHSLISETFNTKWEEMEQRVFEQAKERFQNESNSGLTKVMNVF